MSTKWRKYRVFVLFNYSMFHVIFPFSAHFFTQNDVMVNDLLRHVLFPVSRVITCNPHTEPTQGVLARSLRKRIFHLKADNE